MMGSIIHAIFDHAVWSMKKSTHCIEASPLIVFEYMKSVAKKSPIAMDILIVVFLWELALLARRCERTNNIKEFFNSLPLYLPLCCGTNSTEYTKICFDLLKYWETCSELEKEVITKYGFTLETGSGL